MRNKNQNWFGNCRLCRSRDDLKLLWNKPTSKPILLCQKCIDIEMERRPQDWGELVETCTYLDCNNRKELRLLHNNHLNRNVKICQRCIDEHKLLDKPGWREVE